MSAGKQGVVIVGAGPAGLAPLFASASVGRLNELLERGVTILERGQALGAGELGGYAIGSDSTADALLDSVVHSQEPRLLALRSHPLTRAVAAFGKGSVPLALVGEFLQLAGTALCEAVTASRRGVVLRGATAHWVQGTASGGWRVRFEDEKQRVHEVDSAHVVLASGAEQPAERMYTERVAGAPLFPAYKNKVMQSGEVLTSVGLRALGERLAGKDDPRVAIVGGSTSAAAVANALLTQLSGLPFGEGGITMLHRRPLRIFYETAHEAVADGYNEFSQADICPLTGRVYRLSGFRLESRELIMRVRGIGGRAPEPRLRPFRLSAGQDEAAQGILRAADVIVAALGYRPRLLPVFDAAMVPVSLLAPSADRWAVVDQSCCVRRANGSRLAGLFAIGLAVGPAASPERGGEAGFTGQVNSLWLWQHTLGQRIAEQMLEGTDEGRNRSATLRPEPVLQAAATRSLASLQEWAGAA